MNTHDDDGADAAEDQSPDTDPEGSAEETATIEPAVVAEAIGAPNGPDEERAADDESRAEDADDDAAAADEDELSEDRPPAKPIVPTAAFPGASNPFQAATEAGDTEATAAPVEPTRPEPPREPIPLFPVALASLVLLAAAVGVVYFAIVGGAQAVYTVNGEGPSPDEVAEVIEPLAPDLVPVVQAPEDGTPEQRAQLASVLASLIVEELLVEEAEAQGVEITDADRQETFDDIVEAQFGGDEAAFEAQLEAQGVTREQFEEASELNVLLNVLSADLAEPVTEQQIQAVYDEEAARTVVSHILVETEEEAEDVIDRLESGEDFGEVAQEVSIDTGSGANGGELGPLVPGQFVPEFEEAAAATEPGEITGPVETQFGFHVITVGAPDLPPFEELSGDIEAFLTNEATNQAVQEVLDGLADADVEVDPEYGEWVGPPNMVAPPAASPAELGGDQPAPLPPADEGDQEE